MTEECTCKFKEKCWFHINDGCEVESSEYADCYEYMKFEYFKTNKKIGGKR